MKSFKEVFLTEMAQAKKGNWIDGVEFVRNFSQDAMHDMYLFKDSIYIPQLKDNLMIFKNKNNESYVCGLYDEETVKGLITDYFYDYDYIFGDWAYGKLRLKGFYKENNQEAKRINNIKYLDDYIKLNCAYDCKYFLLEKKG